MEPDSTDGADSASLTPLWVIALGFALSILVVVVFERDLTTLALGGLGFAQSAKLAFDRWRADRP